MPQRFMKCTCGHSDWYDTAKRGERPRGASCSACARSFDQDVPAPVRTFSIGGKSWGEEGRSLKFAFDPGAIRDIGQRCPTLAKAIDPTDGSVRFENDTNQKAIYGEMASEKRRIEDERAAKVAANEDAFLGDGRPGSAIEKELTAACAASAAE